MNFVETRTHFTSQNFNKCKIYKLHGLTFVGLGEAEIVNEVTIAVNCYGVVSSIKIAAKVTQVNFIV